MKTNKIPIPKYKICKSEIDGIKFIDSQKESEWYIKASGLALGKGVIYAKNNNEAKAAIKTMKLFGSSGETFLIEQCLKGEEFTSFAIVDRKDFIVVGHAQDHKTIYDGNVGPNTGGIGCNSPPMVIDKNIESQIESIFKKTVESLVKMKRPYQGILYLGGMIDKNAKIAVIEFNARWGDPEVEVVLPSIKNDLYEIANDVIAGNIKKIKLTKDNLYRIVVTACAKGYPENYSKALGKQIIGLESILNKPNEQYKVFGAGIKVTGNKFIVAGGRLFHVMGQGKNVQEARKIAYNALSKIQIKGNNLYYRKDIGYRDLNRMK